MKKSGLKRMGLRFISVALTIAMLSMFIVACGQQQEDETIVLQVWNPEDSPTAIALMNAAIESFEANNPGVQVEFTTIPWGDIFPRWMTAIETDTTPDISFSSAAFALSLYELGALMPITGIVEDDFFADSAMSLVDIHTTPEGELIGMPFVHNCVVLWYRASALEERGLSVPETWDELLYAAEQLTGDGRYGMLVTASRSHITAQMFYSLMLSNGGTIVDRETGTQNLFGSQANLEALQFYYELSQFTPAGSLGYTRPDAESAMATGLIDMFIYGSWLGGALLETAPEVFAEFSVAPVPTNGGNRGSNMGNMNMVVFSGTEHPELAKAFLLHMLDNEYYIPFVASNPSSYIPVTRAAQESPDYYNHENVVAFGPLVEVVRQELPYSWVYGTPNPNAGVLEGLATITYTITRVLLEGMTPEEALEITAREVGQVLEID